VYLAWRGGLLRPTVTKDETYDDVTQRYGAPLVDPAAAARLNGLTFVVESLSYFDRKSVPEHKFSGTALSRTIFTCAHAARRNQRGSQVLLIGHSFGGLMLERTFQNAAISELTEAWPMGDPHHEIKANPLPFDTVLFVNSAAPSIYAKQFQSYFAAHRQAVHTRTPIVFSLTSRSDSATGKAHHYANILCGLVPTLRRNYRGNDFILEEVPENRDVLISQAYYYRHTPGHNPLLVNRFIEPSTGPERLAMASGDAQPARPAGGRQSYVHRNLSSEGSDPTAFTTTAPALHGELTWTIAFPPRTEDFGRFSKYRGRRPVVWTKRQNIYVEKDSGYWIIRCPKEIISSHDDIWSLPAMETYAALHRIALERGQQPA
jgi:hypothetical protein